MRNCLAKITRVLWLSLLAAVAAAQTQQEAAALLGRGVSAYERKDYATAINALKQAQPALPVLADYLAYYLAAARAESNDAGGIATDLAPVHAGDVRSPLAGKAWLVEARATQTARPADAVQLLLDHYSELPQPEGDLLLAASYQFAGDPGHSAEYYQRVFYTARAADAAAKAGAALTLLKQSMGGAYPQPSPQLLLTHADRLSAARDYIRARAEYQLIAQKSGLEGEHARVRIGVVDYLSSKTAIARTWLRGLALSQPEADAERLYYLAECARRLKEDSAVNAAVEALSSKYPKSPWRLKALVASANGYLVSNHPDNYLPLYKAAYEDFPSDPAAGLWHWKVVFQAYLHDAADATTRLREHLVQYGAHSTASSALYFLGRRAERDGQPGAARTYYQKLTETYQNHYYAMLARERLRSPEISSAVTAPEAQAFAASLRLTEGKPVAGETSRSTAVRRERALLLRQAGLPNLADAELRFGARTDGQPGILAMDLAGSAEAPHQAMRIMKSLSPDYLSLTFDQAPRRFWDLLFPLPFRLELEQDARGEGIDPFLLAGLIRQESEFDPKALSKAKAYGLTQIRPVTGRQFARAAGIQKLAPRQLFQPSVNLRIGTSILRSMLQSNGGQVERTLAAYNAGPARLAQWSTWNTYREPAEFVESIPFTETRDYVQAVLRNADIYRRLYP